MSKHKVGVVGGTGYTGTELVRLLLNHPEVDLEVITSRSKAGQQFAEVHPHFGGLTNLVMQDMNALDDAELDIIFLALPHGVSMDVVALLIDTDARIIDLSGDFRLRSAADYEQWYGDKHSAPDLFERGAFGLPELFRDDIRNAQLVANPGCYPTSAILALAPLLMHDIIRPDGITVDSKSGVTGAGAKASAKTHFPDVFGNFSAYGLRNHRHTPEIQQALQRFSQGSEPSVLFTPHLLPIDRGILTTTYSSPKKDINPELLQETLQRFYANEHFVRLPGRPPQVKHVRGSNFCDIFATVDERTNTIITISVIDNLMKGAAGQAVQNMNVMLGMLENTGLTITPLSP